MPAARVNVFILGPDETCALSVVPKKLETVANHFKNRKPLRRFNTVLQNRKVEGNRNHQARRLLASSIVRKERTLCCHV